MVGHTTILLTTVCSICSRFNRVCCLTLSACRFNRVCCLTLSACARVMVVDLCVCYNANCYIHTSFTSTKYGVVGFLMHIWMHAWISPKMLCSPVLVTLLMISFLIFPDSGKYDCMYKQNVVCRALYTTIMKALPSLAKGLYG